MWGILSFVGSTFSYNMPDNSGTTGTKGGREGGGRWTLRFRRESSQDPNWVWLFFVQNLQFMSQLSCEKLKAGIPVEQHRKVNE